MRLLLLASLCWAVVGGAAELPAWPAAAGTPALTLEFSAGRVLDCDAESSALPQADHLSVRRKGYSDSRFTVGFTLPEDFPGGEYAVWLLYNTGGIGTWKLTFAQFNAAGERKSVSETSIRNQASWQLDYVRAVAPVVLRAGLPELRLTVEGRSGDGKNLYRLCLVPVTGHVPEEPPLPEGFADRPLLSLEGGMLAAPLPGARQLTGELIGHTPPGEAQARQNVYDATVQRKGYSESGMRLRYELPADFPGGEYRLAALYNTGGIAGLNFELRQLDAGGHELATARGVLRNQTSWKMEYIVAPGRVRLAPGGGVLEFTLSGRSGDAKNLRRVLLARQDSRGAALTPEQALLRQRLLAQGTVDAPRKLLLLEGDDPAAGDRLCTALLAAVPDSGVAVAYRAGRAAAELGTEIRAQHLPAAVLLDSGDAVLGILEDPAAAAAFFAEPAKAGYLPTPAAEEVEQFEPGARLLCAGVWAGPAGMSLLGLGTEADLAPQTGDVVPIRGFDRLTPGVWREQRPGPDGRVVIEEKSAGWVWSRGCAYGFCYLVNAEPAELELTIAQSGQETALWLDGALQTPVAVERSSGETRSAEGVTDQGNVFRVEQQAGGNVSRYALKLKPGSHRLLVKLIMAHQPGETFAFSWKFQGDTARVRAALADPAGCPERHRILNRLSQRITVEAPANLPQPGDPLRIRTQLALPRDRQEWPLPPGPEEPERPVLSFPARLVQQLLDYDGKVLREFSRPVTVPGDYLWDAGTAPGPGYYAIRSSLYHPDGRLIGNLYPDGFSVIGGTASRRERPEPLKLMTAFYWLNEQNVVPIADWMARLGIFHNVGSGNGYNPAVREAFAQRGLTLTADFIDTWSSASREARRELARQWGAFTDRFKSLNEIDIFKEARPTPEKWVARTREEYEAVKAAVPDAEYTGGSLVRVGTGDWFEECLKLGLDQYVDRWDVHSYPQRPPRFRDRYLSNSRNEDAQGIDLVYSRLGRPNPHPFILGETGARCSHGADARRWQAETMPKMLAWALARKDYSGIAFLVPWEKSPNGGDISVAHDPAEAALYVAGSLIDGYAPELLSGYPEQLEVARFGSTVMAWSSGAPAAIRLPLKPGVEYVKVDVVGRVTPFAADAELEIGSSPVYVLPRADYERLVRR